MARSNRLFSVSCSRSRRRRCEKEAKKEEAVSTAPSAAARVGRAAATTSSNVRLNIVCLAPATSSAGETDKSYDLGDRNTRRTGCRSLQNRRHASDEMVALIDPGRPHDLGRLGRRQPALIAG